MSRKSPLFVRIVVLERGASGATGSPHPAGRRGVGSLHFWTGGRGFGRGSGENRA